MKIELLNEGNKGVKVEDLVPLVALATSPELAVFATPTQQVLVAEAVALVEDASANKPTKDVCCQSSRFIDFLMALSLILFALAHRTRFVLSFPFIDSALGQIYSRKSHGKQERSLIQRHDVETGQQRGCLLAQQSRCPQAWTR